MIFSDGDQTYMGFCKLKDGFDLSFVMSEIRSNSIFADRPYNQEFLLLILKK